MMHIAMHEVRSINVSFTKSHINLDQPFCTRELLIKTADGRSLTITLFSSNSANLDINYDTHYTPLPAHAE